MTHNPYQTMKYEWAIRTLNPKDEKDKKSITSAKEGYGYYIVSNPDGARQFYVAAFKHFGGELQAGVEMARPHQVEKLERMDGNRYWREKDHLHQADKSSITV